MSPSPRPPPQPPGAESCPPAAPQRLADAPPAVPGPASLTSGRASGASLCTNRRSGPAGGGDDSGPRDGPGSGKFCADDITTGREGGRGPAPGNGGLARCPAWGIERRSGRGVGAGTPDTTLGHVEKYPRQPPAPSPGPGARSAFSVRSGLHPPACEDAELLSAPEAPHPSCCVPAF